jgi:hypothetical protein
LWRCLKARGFRGSLRVVAEWATRRRRAETADDKSLQRVPSARTIARLPAAIPCQSRRPSPLRRSSMVSLCLWRLEMSLPPSIR